jgi:hypothetical protein
VTGLSSRPREGATGSAIVDFMERLCALPLARRSPGVAALQLYDAIAGEERERGMAGMEENLKLDPVFGGLSSTARTLVPGDHAGLVQGKRWCGGQMGSGAAH